MTEPETPEQEASINDVPCTIHAEFSRMPYALAVTEVGGWSYTPQGIFATGRWTHDPDPVDRDVLIPYERVLYIEFDFAALERAINGDPEVIEGSEAA